MLRFTPLNTLQMPITTIECASSIHLGLWFWTFGVCGGCRISTLHLPYLIRMQLSLSLSSSLSLMCKLTSWRKGVDALRVSASLRFKHGCSNLQSPLPKLPCKLDRRTCHKENVSVAWPSPNPTQLNVNAQYIGFRLTSTWGGDGGGTTSLLVATFTITVHIDQGWVDVVGESMQQNKRSNIHNRCDAGSNGPTLHMTLKGFRWLRVSRYDP